MELSGKSQNAFLFHECRKLISKPALKTVYYATNASSSIHCIWSSLYTQSSFFLARTLWSSSYDPYLFFKPLGTVEEMCYWQACRPHGEMESKRAGEPAGWDWIIGLVTSLLGTSASSSEVNQGPLWLLRLSRGFWWTRCLFIAASSGLSGNPISILWGTFAHLLESAVQVSVTSGVRRFFRERTTSLSVTENLTRWLCLPMSGKTWTDWFLSNLRFSSHLLILLVKPLVSSLRV